MFFITSAWGNIGKPLLLFGSSISVYSIGVIHLFASTADLPMWFIGQQWFLYRFSSAFI